MNYRMPTFSEPFEPETETEIVDIGNGDGLALLQAVYRSTSRPLAVRLRAAIAALPFERPKLAVVARVEGRDLASALDQAIERSRVRPKLIEAEKISAASLLSDYAAK